MSPRNEAFGGDRGLSLLEVMVATTLLVIFAVIFSTHFKNMNAEVNQDDARTEAIEQRDELLLKIEKTFRGGPPSVFGTPQTITDASGDSFKTTCVAAPSTLAALDFSGMAMPCFSPCLSGQIPQVTSTFKGLTETYPHHTPGDGGKRMLAMALCARNISGSSWTYTVTTAILPAAKSNVVRVFHNERTLTPAALNGVQIQ